MSLLVALTASMFAAALTVLVLVVLADMARYSRAGASSPTHNGGDRGE